MTLSEPLRREWRQFRLASNDATRRLLNAALFSRESDPVGFAVWMLALLGTPPLFFSVNQLLTYVALRSAPWDVVERTFLGHRLFFITYGMLAALLLASLLWEALFPDRAEQEIVGVLPVRPRTLAAARLAAALRLAGIFAFAITIPAAVVYTFAAASHPALRGIVGLFVGHVVGATLGCLFVFLSLLSIRGVFAVTFGTTAGNWIANVLQLIAIVSLVEIFFYLPAVLQVLVREMLAGATISSWPPVWFAALFAWIGGDHRESASALARLGVGAVAICVAIVAPLYLLSASRIGRQLMETQERHAARSLTPLARAMASGTRQRAGVRGMFVFAVASLSRSRRHLLILSAYFSLGIATVIVRAVTAGMHRPPGPGAPARVRYEAVSLFADQPTAVHLALPLILIFFLVFGLRASFRVPTDVDANWPFRLRPPRPGDCAAAAWMSLVSLGVLPVAVLTLVTTVFIWPTSSALAAALMAFSSGVLLVECVLIGWAQVPFACEHLPTAETVKWKWIGGLVALNVFAFQLAALQAVAIATVSGTAAYVGLMGVAAIAARVFRHRSLRRRETTFDDSRDDAMDTLSLSEALR